MAVYLLVVTVNCDYYLVIIHVLFLDYCLQSIIESFVPKTTDPAQLEDALELSANYIRRLAVSQLLPPAKDRTDADDTTDDDARSVDHFDFNAVLPRLPYVEELDVMYGVRDCGMQFDWSLFQFTTQDCRLLSQCVATCRTLRSLTLHRSKVQQYSSLAIIIHTSFIYGALVRS